MLALVLVLTAAEPHVEAGIRALHDYAFDRAREEFLAAREVEPGNLMAHWGEAMVHFRPLWGFVGRDEMRESIRKLGATPAEREKTAASDKERLYWRALEALLAPEDEMEGRTAFASALEVLARTDPADVEVRAWLAHAQWGLWRQGLPDGENLERIAALSQSVLADEPDHPGGLHYLVHALDSPERAWRALPAAERYARVVSPDSPHAIHMPSHTFLQLGMWEEVRKSNERAWASSERVVEERGLSKESLDFHSIDFLIYAQLQQGRYRAARDTLALLERIHEELRPEEGGWLPDYIASKKAVFVVETALWLDFPVSEDRSVVQAAALGAVHRERFDDAALWLERCRALEYRQEEGTAEMWKWRSACHQAEGFIAFRRGQLEGGLVLLERAHEEELQGGPAWETPDPVKPAAELLGEVYLELGRKQEARARFAMALERRPARSRSLLGAARSSRGEERTRYYELLARQWSSADADLAELSEVRNGRSMSLGRGSKIYRHILPQP